MSNWLRLVVGLIAIGLPTAAAINLPGRVTDETGAGVAQARIAFRLADQAYSAVSDPTGAFSLSLPGPGRYSARVERDGYFPLKDYAVEVTPDTQEIHLGLNHEREVFESVKVSASPSAIDVDQTSSERKLTGLEILDMPYSPSRDLRQALPLLPGVIKDSAGGLHFDGGAERQTQYLLDGFNISDPLSGKLNARVSVEAVRSIDWVSGRYSPEFGKGSSGALQIHTDMGDNPWRYSATNFLPGLDTRGGLHLGTWAPRFNVSGPVIRDRAWFSEHLDLGYSQPVVPDLPQGKNRTETFQGSNLMRGQLDLTPSNILFTDFLVNFDYAPGTGLSAVDPLATTVVQRSRTWFFSAKHQVYFKRGMLLEAGYAEDRNYFGVQPQGTQFYQIMPFSRGGNYYVDSAQRSRRRQILANLFLPSFELAGRHQLKMGIDVDRLDYWQDFRRTGIDVFNVDTSLVRQTVFGGSGLLSRPGLEVSWYAVDEWKLKPNLVVEAGVREDWDELIRRPAVSPRVSFAWAPHGSKDTKISAGYAVLRDATRLDLFARPHDQYAINTYFSPDGSVASGPLSSVFQISNPHLRPSLYQNWTLGLERRLAWNIGFSATYLRKRGRDGLAYTATPLDGVYNLTNSRREVYDAVEIVARQHFGEQYEWIASYTRSHATSNAVVDMTVDQPLQVLYNSGPLSWDAPNRFVSWAYLPTKWQNWAVAYSMEARTGLPYSVVNDVGQIVGPVHSERLPFFFALNLHPEWKFRLLGVHWALRGGFNNITNHKNPTIAQTIPGLPVRFYGSEGRHFVFRLRWLGSSK